MGKNAQRRHSYADQGFREAVAMLESMRKRGVVKTAWRSNLRALRYRKRNIPKQFRALFSAGVTAAKQFYGVS